MKMKFERDSQLTMIYVLQKPIPFSALKFLYQQDRVIAPQVADDEYINEDPIQRYNPRFVFIFRAK